MTIVRVKGFKIFDDRHGQKRCYHRKSGTAIDLKLHPLGSAEFFAECQRIVAMQQQLAPADPRPGTLGLLIERYREHRAFLDLSARSRSDYQKVFDYLAPIAGTALATFTKPLVIRIRDKAGEARGRRFGTYVKQVLSLLFEWGTERGFLAINPAAGVKAIPAPKDAPEANRPWTDTERDAVLAALPAHMMMPIGLMMFCGVDPGDVVTMPKTVIKDGALDTSRNKTGEPVWVMLPDPMLDIWKAAPQHDAITLCANSDGRPWARGASGLRASFRPIRMKLEKAKVVEPGLTLKGLRHTVATILREIGKDEQTIADLLGQRSPAMARHYSRRANLKRKNTSTVADFNEELNRRRTSTVKPH